MGKNVCKNIRKLIIFIIIMLLLFTTSTYSISEHDLFNSAYDYYLSYQPEKAIEEFKKFINEFPNSSAKDGALFWLGKSLMQIGSYEEAEKVFNDLKTEFSNSLYIKFANRELENIEKKKKVILAEKPIEKEQIFEKKEVEVTKKEIPKLQTDAAKEKIAIKAETKKEEVKEQIVTKKPEKQKTLSEHIKYIIQAGTFKNKTGANKLSSQLRKLGFKSYIIETTKDQTPLFIVTAGEYENKDKANESAKKIKKKIGIDVIIKDIEKVLIAKVVEKATPKDETNKKQLDVNKIDSEKITARSEQQEITKIVEPIKPLENLEEKKTPEFNVEITKKEPPKELFIDIKKAPEDIEDTEDIEDIEENIEEEKQIKKPFETQKEKKTEELAKLEKSFDSSTLPEEYKNFLKLNTLWKTGNEEKDLIIKEELIKKAQKQNIIFDVASFNKFIKEHNISDKQSEALYKEFIIGKLIENELKNLLDELWVELIYVKYTDKDKYTKIVIAPELQNQAKSGTKFEEIHKMYPEYTSYKIVTPDNLDTKLKEKIKYLNIDDVGVVWDKEGYTIMKLTKKGFDIVNFDNLDQKNKEYIKNYIKQWIESITSIKT